MKTRMLQLVFFGLLAVIFFFNLGNYENMSSGYTGAPGEDDCGSCHTPQVIGMIGGVVLDGLPNVVFPNQSLTLQVKVYDSDGTVQPENGGFMLTALNPGNAQFGTLFTPSAFTKLFNSQGRQCASDPQNSPKFPWHFRHRYGVLRFQVESARYRSHANGHILLHRRDGQQCRNAQCHQRPGIYRKRHGYFCISPVAGNITIDNQINCFGQNTGVLTANPAGGLTPYSYSWSNGSHNQTATNLAAGAYTVTVTDAAGQTGTASAALAQPPQLNLSISNTQHVSCFGDSDGQASTLTSRWNATVQPCLVKRASWKYTFRCAGRNVYRYCDRFQRV